MRFRRKRVPDARAPDTSVTDSKGYSSAPHPASKLQHLFDGLDSRSPASPSCSSTRRRAQVSGPMAPMPSSIRKNEGLRRVAYHAQVHGHVVGVTFGGRGRFQYRTSQYSTLSISFRNVLRNSLGYPHERRSATTDSQSRPDRVIGMDPNTANRCSEDDGTAVRCGGGVSTCSSSPRVCDLRIASPRGRREL